MKFFKWNRDSVGKFAKKEATLKGKIFLSLAVVGITMAYFQIFFSQPNEYVKVAEAEAPVVDKFEAKIEALKWGVIDELEICENEKLNNTAKNVSIIYDNKKDGSLKGADVYSLGVLKFKIGTVQYFVKLRDNKTLTADEAASLAHTRSEARNLAHYAIFEKGGVDNWHNCSVKLNLASKIAMIKSLEN